MSKTRVIMLDILITAASWAVMYSIVIVPLYYLYGFNEVYRALLTVVPFFAAQYIRFKVKSFSVFFLFHLLLVLAVLALPMSLPMKLIYAAFAAVSLVYSFTKRLRETNDQLSVSFVVFCVGVCIALTLLCGHFQMSVLNVIFITASAFVMLCYLLYTHIYNIDMSLEAITRTTIQPVDKILSFNNKIVLFFLAIVALFTAFSRFYHIDLVIVTLGRLLLAGIRFVVSRLFTGEELPQEEIIQQPEDGGGGNVDMGMLDTGETGIIWVILETILYYLVMVIVVAGAVAAVCYAAYSLYRRFYKSAKDDIEIKEFILPEVNVEGTASVLGRLRDLMPSFGLSAAARVRQLFYKKVKKQINNGFEMNPSYTANEIAGNAADAEITALTPLYEKARYSGEPPRADELRAVRK